MSGAIPPIPPPFGASSGNPGSPNANRVDTMPTTTDPINTTTTTNVAQSVVDENLPQLLDSRGGSHVTNVPAFDKEDFTSWKVRFLVFLDGLEPYLLKTLEDGPFVPMSSLSTTENPLPKRQNQWSNAESQTQRFSIQASSSKALISNTPFQDSDSDVEEDQRTNNEFMADLNAEYHERALLENQKRFYKRSGRLIKSRFGGYDESKEMLNIILKLQFEGFLCIKLRRATKGCDSCPQLVSMRSGTAVDEVVDLGRYGLNGRRRSGKQEDSKALVTLDGEGVDWTSHSKDEQENYALMACNSSGSDIEDYPQRALQNKGIVV
ncbi:hypothetical protein Tco_0962596 [Tanacetum coccineum]